MKVIMDCRATVTRKFRTRLGDSFEGEIMQTQYKVLICRIDSYVHNCIDYEKKQKNDKKQQDKKMVVNLLELILAKKTLIFLKLSIKCLAALKNRLRKHQ